MRLGKRLYSLVMFVVVSGLGGLLIAGLLVPATTMLATTGRDAALSLDALPAELETPPLSERSRLLNADGSLLTYLYKENRLYVSIDKIAPIMQVAQVAIEDHRFYEHGAFDLQGTLRAMVSTSQGVTQGGSSITQQYVRLVQVEVAEANNDALARTRATENTLARKIRELRFAIAMEKKYSKDEILERYLNIAYYGDGAYGVEAAARHYFGVNAADLSLPQAAMLAGLVRNPVATDPVDHEQVAIERRNNVLDRMAELGKITAAEAAEAKEVPFDQDKVRKNKLDCANAEFPFICDYAKEVLVRTPSLGATTAERLERIYRGGLTIKTTIDPKVQRKAEKTIKNYVSAKDPVISVIVMMEPGSGRLVTMAQNRTKMGKKNGQTYYNYAVSQAMNGADGYQGGSTFKAFVAAAALEKGMGAYGVYNAQARMSFQGKTFKSCEGSFQQPGKWDVVNASPSGKMNMFSGVKNSVNTYFAQLIQAVGVCESVKMAKKLGLEVSSEHRDVVEDYHDKPSFTLGTIEATPISLVEAYATFGARGMHCDPVIIDSITTRDGTELEVPDGNCKRVLSKDVADAMNLIFQGPYNGGTATSAKVPGVQMAGKTGTVPSNRAVWTVGYTPELAAAAMISYDNNPKYKKFWDKQWSYLRSVTLPASGRWLSGFSGDNAGRNLLKPAFAYTIKRYDQTRFKDPPQSVLRGEMVGVPSCSGTGLGTCKSILNRAGFTSFVEKVDSDAAEGSVVGTSPSGRAPKLSSVAILVSKGPKKGSDAYCALHPGHSSCVKPDPDPPDPGGDDDTSNGDGGDGNGRGGG